MRKDDPLVREVRRELLEAQNEELIREAMKSVAADAGFRELAGQGERLGEIYWMRWKAVSKQAIWESAAQP